MTTNSLFRGVALAGAAVLVITFAQRTVSADEVFIAGFTRGCFGAGCVPTTSSSSVVFTFSSSTFATTTTSGFSLLNGAANPGSNFNNLGSFTMSSAPGSLDPLPFTLKISLTAPQGFTGSQEVLINGTRTPINMMGGVLFEWNPHVVVFTFNDTNCEPNPTGEIPGQQTTCGTGTFRFFVHDLLINPNETVALSGSINLIEQQPIPEPTTMLLLGTGLAGIAGIVRRRSARAGKK